MPATPSHRPRGVLVAAEGLDGSGKTAGLDAIARWLERSGRRVHVVRWEPSRRVARASRAGRGRQSLTPRVAALLAAAEAAERIGREIVPRLGLGQVVLADRYAWTGVAREVARGLDERWVAGLYAFAPVPDLIVYQRQDPAAALAAAMAWRPARHGSEAVAVAYEAFLDRMLVAFEDLASDPTTGPWPVDRLVLDVATPRTVRDRAVRDALRPVIQGAAALPRRSAPT